MARPRKTEKQPDVDSSGGAFEWLMIGLVALTPVVPWPFVHTGALGLTEELFGPAQALVFAVLTAAATVVRPASFVRFMRHVTTNPLDLAVWALALWFGLSSLWTTSAPHTWKATTEVTLTLLFYVAAKHAALRPGFLAILIGWIHGAVALNVVYAVAQLVGWPPALFGFGEEPIALMGNRNHLAYLLALTLPLGLFRGWTTSPVLRRLGLFNAYVGFLVLLGTRSRGGLLAGLVGLAVFHGLKREQDRRTLDRQRRPYPARVLVGMGVFAILTVFAVTVWPMGVLAPGKAVTAQSRLFTWRLTVSGAKSAPWMGQGAGTFPHQFQDLQGRYFAGLLADPARLGGIEWRLARFCRHAHNDYLQLYFELGLVGLLLGAAILVLTTRSFLASYLQHGNPQRLRFYPVFGAVLACGLAQALTGFPFQVHATRMLIVLALAVVSALSHDERTGHGDERLRVDPPLATRDWFTWGVIAILCAVLGRGALSGWRAETLRAAGTSLLRVGDFPAAGLALQRALQIDPLDGRAWNSLGQVFTRTASLEAARAAFVESDRLYRSSAVHVNLGSLEGLAGRPREALAQFEKAVEMEPCSSENHFRVGFARAELNDLPGAADAMRRALTIPRDVRVGRDPGIVAALARIQAQLGDLVGARQMYEENIEVVRALLIERGSRDTSATSPERNALMASLLGLAAVAQRQGQDDLARRCYDELRQLQQ